MKKQHFQTQHQELIENALNSVLELEYTIEEQALDLSKDFYQRRAELQAEAQAIENTEALGQNRKPKRFFCQLNLSTRMLRGTLQIYWHTIYFTRTTKQKKYKYIPLSRTGTYDLRTLLSKSHPFEKELIKETEAKATVIRLQWKKLIEARKPLHRLKELSK